MTGLLRTGWTEDQRTQTCAVQASPELIEQWNQKLANANESVTDGDLPLLRLQREPRRLGFNDGVIVPPEQFPVGTPISAIARAAADRAPLRGTVRVAVVLVDFSDKPMTATTANLEELFFSTGVLPHGSVKEYYTEVSNGLVTLDGVVVGPYRMPQTLAWYANNGSGIGLNGTAFRSPQLARDAAVASNPDVDYTPYDNDGNGVVDGFIVVHAGSGAEVTGSLGDIWSHKSTLSSAYTADATQIYPYLTIPENAKIGVSAHELGHLLFGLPDLYDTDYSSEGIGNWCLMAGGTWNGGGAQPAHPSAWAKVDQGWVSTTVVTTNGSITVPDVETNHQVFRLWKDGAPGTEYFLLENRQQTGSDGALPGSGLLLWHIDETQPGNTDENHYKVALLQADGNRDMELNHNRGDAGDPFPGSTSKTSVDGSTTPNTHSYANADTCVAITGIPASSASMTVNVRVTCKTILKDFKDTHKEIHKEGHKEFKKELIKEFRKELVKEHNKDFKDIKDRFENFKDLSAERPWDRPWEKFGFGGGGGGIGGGGAPGEAGPDVEARLSALESVVYGSGDAGQGAEPFIGADLRPDLIGAPGSVGNDAALIARMAAGDPTAKREYDTRVR